MPENQDDDVREVYDGPESCDCEYLERSIQNLQDQGDAIQAEFDEQLAKEKREIQSLQQTIYTLQMEIKELRAGKEHTKTLKVKEEALKQEISLLRHRNEELQRQIQSAQSDVMQSAVMASGIDVPSEEARLKGIKEALVVELAAAQQELEQCKDAIKAVKLEIAHKQSKLDEPVDDLYNLKDLLRNIQDQIDDAKVQLAAQPVSVDESVHNDPALQSYVEHLEITGSPVGNDDGADS